MSSKMGYFFFVWFASFILLKYIKCYGGLILVAFFYSKSEWEKDRKEFFIQWVDVSVSVCACVHAQKGSICFVRRKCMHSSTEDITLLCDLYGQPKTQHTHKKITSKKGTTKYICIMI